MSDITIGDRFLLSGTAELGLEWAVLATTNDMAFIVPFDMHWMVGTWDVEVKNLPDYGPAVLRCSRGVWTHVKNLQQGLRGARLEDTTIQEAKIRLAALAGQDVPVTSHSEIDDDPEYEKWLLEITIMTEKMQACYWSTIHA